MSDDPVNPSDFSKIEENQLVEMPNDVDSPEQQITAGDSDSPTDHKAVQIIFRDDTNGYRIDKEAFRRIFIHSNVANTPVAIYSIVGPSRTGKSFMLNLFLSFLTAKNNNMTQLWLQSKQFKLDEGFTWSVGMDHKTEGIWIWNEPFFVQTDQHDRVALFLMDTQGWFVSSSSVKDNSVIFALSTLISSMLLCNVEKKLSEESLLHLDDLIFLVRDWSYSYEHQYGFDGGSELLDNVFNVKLDNHENKSVRTNLRDSFKNILCFLIPHPGKEVSERMHPTQGPLDLTGADKDFQNMVDVLVKRLFNPDDIVVKQENNNLVTGKDLIDFTFKYFDLFSREDMPTVGTVSETAAMASILKITQECRDTYSRQMDQTRENKHRTDRDILDIHEENKRKVLINFDQRQKLGSNSFIAKHRKILEDSINKEFEEKFIMANKDRETNASEVDGSFEKPMRFSANYTNLEFIADGTTGSKIHK